MSSEHSFDDFAPLGNRFKSSSSEPERKRGSLHARNKVDNELSSLAESYIKRQVASKPNGENKNTFDITQLTSSYTQKTDVFSLEDT